MDQDSEIYYLITDLFQVNYRSKVRFNQFVKVWEVNDMQYSNFQKYLEVSKISELREIAKKFRRIDGGLKPTGNVYKAKVFKSGKLIDIKSGKCIQMPICKINSLFRENFGGKTKKLVLLPNIPKISTNALIKRQKKKSNF